MVIESVLDKNYHARLIEDIDSVSARAGVPVHLIHQSSKLQLTKPEADYLSHIKENHLNNKYGLVIYGGINGSIELKFMSMCAVLLRNYIDGSVMTLADVIQSKGFSPQVLLIPNFYTTTEGKPLSSWQIQELQSILTKRMVEAKQTIVYVADMHMMLKHYGQAVNDLLVNNYESVSE